jgi:hypothetical protein
MNPKPNIDALSNVPARSNEPDFGLSGSDFLRALGGAAVNYAFVEHFQDIARRGSGASSLQGGVTRPMSPFRRRLVPPNWSVSR